MATRLEHANLIVRNIDSTILFLQTAFPRFRIRHDSGEVPGGRWVHFGCEDSYIALEQATREPTEPWQPYSGRPGLNHLGYAVDDVAALRTRMLEAGYQESTIPNHHRHRRRVYFYDKEGNDWEFVQYLSAEPADRNDYAIQE